ncbi:leucine-rich repeat neuronal protein 4 [Vanacampus margaritifer]
MQTHLTLTGWEVERVQEGSKKRGQCGRLQLLVRGEVEIIHKGEADKWRTAQQREELPKAFQLLKLLQATSCVMAPSRPAPTMLIYLLLLSASTSQPTTKPEPGANRTRPLRPRAFPSEVLVLPPDNYYDTNDDVTTVPPETVSAKRGTLKRCDYNPCEENQPACIELAAANNCLCPGSTSKREAPQPPFLKTLTWNGSDVVLRWCAPYSFVKAYKVTVGGAEKQTFGRSRRSGGVGPIQNISKVCLVALNDAGDSEGSCLMYQPEKRSASLIAGLIGGALGLLLLLLLAALLWRRRRQRKLQNSISVRGTAEI